MTFWQFLDRRIDKIRARGIAGAGVFALTILILIMLWRVPSLAENDLFKTLAQAIVVQGLVGLAMAFWFTAKDRDEVEITNPPDDPVPTTETKEN